MSIPSTSIDICVCTFRRAHVANTLASLALLEPPADCTMRIIVADNDDAPSAQVIVATAAEQYGLNVTYIHAPAQNISIARNACLNAATGNYTAFIDDDEIVSTGWLKALLTSQRESGAAIILGPVRAVYADETPDWLLHGNFHSTQPVRVRGKILTGYAGNVLIDRRTDALRNLRFRDDFGITGGEDTDYFTRARLAGARIEYAEAALVYEAVPPERANFTWLCRRRRRFGETHARMLLEARKPPLPHMVLAFAKAAVCFVAIVPFIFHGIARRRWFLRGIFHLSVALHLKRSLAEAAHERTA